MFEWYNRKARIVQELESSRFIAHLQDEILRLSAERDYYRNAVIPILNPVTTVVESDTPERVKGKMSFAEVRSRLERKLADTPLDQRAKL